MPHLLRLGLKSIPSEEAAASYPFSLSPIRTLPLLDVNISVTFFVGENGSGKSTLLEAVAVAAELPAVGGTHDIVLDPSVDAVRKLGASLRLAWTQRSRKGFFLRSEDFFGHLKWLARDKARDIREKSEALTGVRADVPRVASFTAEHVDEGPAKAFLAAYDNRSHGESFMDLFETRVRAGGLYLLDEPEAPLSPKRQLALLDLLVRTGKAGAQFIIATHSPILLGCPDARIYSFDRVPIAETEYADLEHVVVTRDFLNDRVLVSRK